MLLVDEVTRVENWAGTIRGMADNGELDDASVIATGSQTTDLRKGGERLPGRRGRGTDLDVQMHPLSFREYVQLLHPSVLLSSPVASLDRNDVAAGHLSRLGSRNALVALLPRYLATGSFLSALNDQAATGSVQPDSYQKYREALVGEFTRAGLRESYLREVMIWMLSHLGKEFDSRGIAADTDIGSKDTARSYVQHLDDTYTIDVLYRTNNLDKPAPNFRAPKKMHTSDPLFFHMLRAWAEADMDTEDRRQMRLNRPHRHPPQIRFAFRDPSAQAFELGVRASDLTPLLVALGNHVLDDAVQFRACLGLCLLQWTIIPVSVSQRATPC